MKMTTAQVVETSVTVTNSSFQNYTHPDDHTTRTTDTPGFKPFTVIQSGTKFVQIIVNKRESNETQDISLLYVFVIVFGLDPAQATIGLEKCWSN